MMEDDVPIQEIFLNEALQVAIPGDLSWWKDMDELVALYELREENANNFWVTPQGSPERENWDNFNQPYIAALNIWERTWKIVVGNHQKNNFITFEAASDALRLKGNPTAI